MSSEMKVSISNMEGRVPVAVFQVSGQIDASNVAELEDKTLASVNSGAKDLLLDLSGVTFMSSAGFRVVHKVYQALHPDGEGGSHFKLLNPSDEIARLIKTLGFDKFVAVENGDLQAAVDSF